MECREFCVKEDVPADAAGEVDNHLRIARSQILATTVSRVWTSRQMGPQGASPPFEIAGKRL